MRGRMAGSDPDDPTAVLDPVPSHFAGLTRGLRVGVESACRRRQSSME